MTGHSQGAGRSRPLSARLTRDMRNFLPPRSALLVVLLASVAVAKERTYPKERAPESRFLLLSQGSKEQV